MSGLSSTMSAYGILDLGIAPQQLGPLFGPTNVSRSTPSEAPHETHAYLRVERAGCPALQRQPACVC